MIALICKYIYMYIYIYKEKYVYYIYIYHLAKQILKTWFLSDTMIFVLALAQYTTHVTSHLIPISNNLKASS